MSKEHPLKSEEKRLDRDERGRLLPGHSIPGPGRTPGSLDFMAICRRNAEETGHDLETAIWITARAMFKKSIKGDVQAAKFIVDRLCGLLKQEVAIEGNNSPVMLIPERAKCIEEWEAKNLATAAGHWRS